MDAGVRPRFTAAPPSARTAPKSTSHWVAPVSGLSRFAGDDTAPPPTVLGKGAEEGIAESSRPEKSVTAPETTVCGTPYSKRQVVVAPTTCCLRKNRAVRAWAATLSALCTHFVKVFEAPSRTSTGVPEGAPSEATDSEAPYPVEPGGSTWRS